MHWLADRERGPVADILYIEGILLADNYYQTSFRPSHFIISAAAD